MHRLGITFLMVLVTAAVVAQDSLRKEIDSLTYRQYIAKDYKALIETGKKARRQHIDFYYLNYRTAIAYYELKNYAKAAEFYRKALTETPDDEILLESLYYAYLLSGQKESAAIAAKSLSPHKQAVIGYKPSAVDFVSLSGGYLVNDNKPGIKPASAGTDSLNQFQDMFFAALGVGFKLSDNMRLKFGYQFYNTKYQDSKAGTLLNEDYLSQHQLVAAMEYLTQNNVTWGFAGGYYNLEMPYKSTLYTIGRRKGFRPGTVGTTVLTETNKTVSAFSVLTFLNKRFAYTLPEIAVAYSNFGGENQYQAKGSLTYYPLGNLDFYGTTGLAFIYNQNTWTNNQFIFSQSLGVKLSKQLWLDGNVSIGDHQNYITERSFLVYDTYDPIKATAGVSLSFFFDKTMLAAGYQWQQKEGFTYFSTGYDTYKYNNHLFNIALQWNF